VSTIHASLPPFTAAVKRRGTAPARVGSSKPYRSATSRVSPGGKSGGPTWSWRTARTLKEPTAFPDEQYDRNNGEDKNHKIRQPELVREQGDRDRGQKSQRTEVGDSAVPAQEVIERQQDYTAAKCQSRQAPSD